MAHPEGVYYALSTRDDRMWPLESYLRCLEDWDYMNAALKAATDELAMDQSEKHKLRYGGLSILREVDNCG